MAVDVLLTISSFVLVFLVAKDRKSASSSAPGKPESPAAATDTSPLLSTDDKDAAAVEEAEELDDAEKELQRLADDHAEMNGSPPPTLGDSRTSSALSSERGVAPMPITAIATFKTLESPRSVVFTSSRPTSAEQHATPAPNLDTNVEVSLIRCPRPFKNGRHLS